MALTELGVGFIPLVDMAPLAVAHEIGFAEEEGLALRLTRAPSWSTLRDSLALGQIDAAHMLAPVPVASALGLGGMPARFDVLSILSINGDVIGVSAEMAAQMQAHGHDFAFNDARAAGTALLEVAPRPIRLGVPFPFSMHAELVFHWLDALGLPSPQGLHIRTVPPPRMSRALADGEVDAFCVGEPWGTASVADGHGALLLPGSAIWERAPEKVLAVRSEWSRTNEDLAQRLIRTMWRAQRWLGQAGNLMTASEILARRDYLNVPADLIDRALTGRLMVTGPALEVDVPGFLRFDGGAAGFPWRSQAKWIANRLAARTGLDRQDAMAAAADVFRTDLYRRALRDSATDLPGASEKVEGAILEPTPVASHRGTLILQRDAFFDGSIFDPAP